MRWTIPPNVPDSHPYWDTEDILWGPQGQRWYESSLTPEQRATVELERTIAYDNADVIEQIAVEHGVTPAAVRSRIEKGGNL